MYNGGSGNAIVKMPGSTTTNLHIQFSPVAGVFPPFASRPKSQVLPAAGVFLPNVCTPSQDKQDKVASGSPRPGVANQRINRVRAYEIAKAYNGVAPILVFHFLAREQAPDKDHHLALLGFNIVQLVCISFCSGQKDNYV
jgi:hypothetical protein